MNISQEEIIKRLKAKGHKITKAREQILEIFMSNNLPIAATDLIDAFKISKFRINKTTIYRELDFLLKNQIIKEIEFLEGKKRYELVTDEHHHHIICLNCRKVEDVELKVDLYSEEERIAKQKKFKVIDHSLEFFGYCFDCRSLNFIK